MWLYLPVRIVARLGVQIEFVTNALRNSIPSCAIRSMFGVLLIRDPYALIEWAAWSSDMMKRMFGLLTSVVERAVWAGAAEAAQAATSAAASMICFTRDPSGEWS